MDNRKEIARLERHLLPMIDEYNSLVAKHEAWEPRYNDLLGKLEKLNSTISLVERKLFELNGQPKSESKEEEVEDEDLFEKDLADYNKSIKYMDEAELRDRFGENYDDLTVAWKLYYDKVRGDSEDESQIDVEKCKIEDLIK